MAPSEKDLAGEYVVAYVQVVIREASPRVADDRNIRKHVLETGGAGLGSGEIRFQEYVLGHMVGGAHSIERIGAEILDAQHPVVAAELKILGLDVRCLDGAPGDLGLDDGRLPLRLLGHDLGRRLVAPVEPATARQQRSG